MNVVVLGSGGREHALVKALKKSPKVSNVYCIPGSDGIALEAHCENINLKETEKLIQYLKSEKIEFIVVGPEDPLVDGLADILRENDFKVFGPGAEGAKLEGSKIYSKEFMKEAGIPTAGFKVATTKKEALSVIGEFRFPIVVKADVLAAGKGVSICKTEAEYILAMEQIFDQKTFGPSNVLIEEFISGWELSYICITDGTAYGVCPLVQDHKALKDGGLGPNTGGMGVFGPISMDTNLQAEINKTIVEPSLKLLKKRNISFCGALFIGLMIEDGKPYVLEYNVRFGDPETQIIMPLIDGDVFEILLSAVEGSIKPIKTKNEYAACIVLAAEAYPEAPVKGSLIQISDLKPKDDSYFIYSGVKKVNNDFVVNGGRVMGAVAIAGSKDEVLAKAYAQSNKANWKGLQKRNDIGRYFK
jgi:phosphoribosylamine---glycine ligase